MGNLKKREFEQMRFMLKIQKLVAKEPILDVIFLLVEKINEVIQ